MGQWWFTEVGGGTLDNLVAGLARVALEPLVGLFTEGIACKVNEWFGQEYRPIVGKGGWRWRAGRSRGGWEDTQTTYGEENEGLSLPSPSLPGLLFPLNTNVAVVHPDAMSIIFAVTFHCIVGEVTLRYFKIGVDDHL